MSKDEEYRGRVRILSDFLRQVDDDAGLSRQLQQRPGQVLREHGVDKAFGQEKDFEAFVGKLKALEGEAWLATVHSMIEVCEIAASSAPPSRSNISFAIENGGVVAVSNRGDIAKKVDPNPFYNRSGKGDSTIASDTRPNAQSAPGKKIRIYGEFPASDLSQQLGKLYLSTYYQRTLIKRVVIDDANLVDDPAAGDGVRVSRSEYHGVRFEVHSRVQDEELEVTLARQI